MEDENCAFKMGLIVCNGNQEFTVECNTKYMKQFYCYKRGKKCDKEKGQKAYTKVDVRTGCKAMIEFWLNDEGRWAVIRHELFLNGGVMRIWKIFDATKHTNGVYTIGAYRLFEDQFIKFLDYCQGLLSSNNGEHVYEYLEEEMLRKFSDLIFATELNMNARECIEEVFKMMKDNIIAEVGPYYVDNSENECRSFGIKDPVGRRVTGARNIRKKSIAEIKCNQAREDSAIHKILAVLPLYPLQESLHTIEMDDPCIVNAIRSYSSVIIDLAFSRVIMQEYLA
ncbi:hypothetical protein M9H77_31630 [Catharanthus roseus]|uniref:Uncharacterized protein n=1 Tax=Catharanthus roseus TaxID=4058 RepID=A0ACC0A4V9_CATRO|nr:hypothetical protein M9H77_31630 [Catharanthus roseus]